MELILGILNVCALNKDIFTRNLRFSLLYPEVSYITLRFNCKFTIIYKSDGSNL